LVEYRKVWRDNRTIQALPDLLAATSTYAIWDDHEVRNDFAGQTVDPTLYANGRQAMLEYMPIWDAGLPDDPTCAGPPFFRVYSWGDTADIIILDQRSCRDSDVLQACYLIPGELPDPAPTLPPQLRVQFGLLPNPPMGCLDAINDPDRTFLGPVQKQLFKNALLSSTARYKIVVNEVPIQQIFFLPYDRWEGYAAERQEILNFLRDNAVENVIFVAADTHANLINQVFVDAFVDPRPLAWEFVTGPIATTTLEEAIRDLLGQGGLDAAHDMLNAVGMECRHLDAYSYGLVEVDVGSGEITVSLKDETGAILLDQIHPEVSCQVTLGPPSLSYLPAVFATP
jgi:alkaline phosphatase D